MQLVLLKENCEPGVSIVETTAKVGQNTLLYPSKRTPLLGPQKRFTAHTLKIDLIFHRTTTQQRNVGEGTPHRGACISPNRS